MSTDIDISSSTDSHLSGERKQSENKLWERLCEYAYRCMVAEQANSLVDFFDKDKWFIHQGEEKLITGLEDSVPMPDSMLQLLDRQGVYRGNSRSGTKTELIYGWPIVVIPHSKSQQLAPLFSVAIEADNNSGEWMLHATSEPEMNQAIIASDFSEKWLEEELKDALGSGIKFGNSKKMRQAATEFADLMGLTVMSDLDISNLDTDIEMATGIYNSAAFLLAPSVSASLTVREELLELKKRTDWRNTAAAFLIERGRDLKKKSIGRPAKSEKPMPLASPLPSNKSMEQVLENLRFNPLTVVTGPPGTGKTQLVANAVSNAWLDNQTVLVTSTNNAAVDVATSRAEESICEGLLIRTGNKRQREQVTDRVVSAKAKSKSWLTDHSISGTEASEALVNVTKERGKLLRDLEDSKNLDARLLKSTRKLEKYDGLLWPEAEPLSQTLERLDKLDEASLDNKESQIKRLSAAWFFRKYRIRRFFKKNGLSSSISPDDYSQTLEGFLKWVRHSKTYKKLRTRHKQLTRSLHDSKTELVDLDTKWHAASRIALQSAVADSLRANQKHISPFNQIGPGNPLRKVIGRMLAKKILRGWACTTYSMKYNFELKAGMFDLVIFDEASQCNLAVVLPLAYRAKRLGVIGDPQQLRPVVRVGDNQLRQIAGSVRFNDGKLRDKGVHYGEGSAYWAFESVFQPELPSILNEHYRCHPTIARWFTQHFYKGELVTLTEVSQMSERDRNIFWIDVKGEAHKSPGGSWENHQEADQAVEQAWIFFHEGLSVGVLTPFAAQAGLIRRKFIERLGRHRFAESGIEIGTAHRLQGAERDAIVFSTVLSPEMNPRVTGWLERERNLINVAVSRAKQVLAVLGHPLISDFAGPTLRSLRAYCLESEHLEHTKEPHSTVDAEEVLRTDSKAEKLLLAALREADMTPYAKPLVEGYELDFALLEGDLKLNLEVDGVHHTDQRGRQRRQDLQRDRILESLGWKVMRIPAWRCYMELGQVIDEIKANM